MSFDELVFGETSYCFFRGTAFAPESAKATPRRIFLAFSPGEGCDFLLTPRAHGALIDRAGILRAFSAYLSLFLGYPECELAVRLGERTEPLCIPGAPLALYPSPPVFSRLAGEERILCPDGSEILTTGCVSQVGYRFFFAAEPGRVDLSLLSARLSLTETGNTALPAALSEKPDPSGCFCLSLPEKPLIRAPETDLFAASAVFLRKTGRCGEEVRLRKGNTVAVCRFLRGGGISVLLPCRRAVRHSETPLSRKPG